MKSTEIAFRHMGYYEASELWGTFRITQSADGVEQKRTPPSKILLVALGVYQ